MLGKETDCMGDRTSDVEVVEKIAYAKGFREGVEKAMGALEAEWDHEQALRKGHIDAGQTRLAGWPEERALAISRCMDAIRTLLPASEGGSDE